MPILAIIPARGGSKGIPDKNIAVVAGQPLIAWTIAAARAATAIDRVVVSTDSPRIAEIAVAKGAEVPFLRPAALAGDHAPGMAVILHALGWLAEHDGRRPDVVMCLQPTSPLRTAQDIDAAAAVLTQPHTDAVVSVTAAEHHPAWMKQIDPSGRLVDFGGSAAPVRRQDLPPAYALNGAIYMARRPLLEETGDWYGGTTRAYVMPAERSLDIDTPWHLHLADLLLRERSGE